MWFVVDVVKRGRKGIHHGRLGGIPFRPWILTTLLRFDMPILNVAFADEARSTWQEALRKLAKQLNPDCSVPTLDWNHGRVPQLDFLQIWAEKLGLNSKLISSLVPCSTRVIQPWKPLDPLKHWLNGLDLGDERISSFIAHLIPFPYPFGRNINLFARKLVQIPPMSKINALFDQLVSLRFRCLGHL